MAASVSSETSGVDLIFHFVRELNKTDTPLNYTSEHDDKGCELSPCALRRIIEVGFVSFVRYSHLISSL